MAIKAKHAHGKSANLQAAIDAGTVDAFDVLFLDADTEPKFGWVDAQGRPIILSTGQGGGEDEVIVVDSLPTEGGLSGVIYLYENKAYVWNGTECVPASEGADLTEIQEQLDEKVDMQTVQDMIEAYSESVIEVVEF